MTHAKSKKQILGRHITGSVWYGMVWYGMFELLHFYVLYLVRTTTYTES